MLMIQDDIRRYKMIQDVTRWCKVIKDLTICYKALLKKSSQAILLPREAVQASTQVRVARILSRVEVTGQWVFP